MSAQPKLARFQQYVLARYHIYNSIFMTLPFSDIEKTGVLLPLFDESCRKGFEDGEDPASIVERFFEKYQPGWNEKRRMDLLFRFIQYIERQVVLFDAIEDAAFPIVNNMDGIGTLRNLKEMTSADHKQQVLRHAMEEFKVRIVLTAHPTQFYPGSVLGIITDLTSAIRNSDLMELNDLLAQLGKTPFFHHVKPTPFDEAVSLTWYLENVFYNSVGIICDYIRENIFDGNDLLHDMINIGFWPGGDRDGNPFVTADTTLKVARRLKQTILRNYYRDIRKLKRRLTFTGVEERVQILELKLYEYSIDPDKPDAITCDRLLDELHLIQEIIENEHQSLYVDELKSLINKVNVFRFHFATLDIRQDSGQHHHVFEDIVKTLIESGSDIFPKNFNELSRSVYRSAYGRDATDYEGHATDSGIQWRKGMQSIHHQSFGNHMADHAALRDVETCCFRR